MRTNDTHTRSIILAPLLQIRDAPAWGKMWGGIMGGVQFMVGDLFVGILALVTVAGGIDYFYGRKLAQLRHGFDPVKAELGLHSKIVGIVLLMLVRSFEFWLSRVTTAHVALNVDTHGLVAVALAVILLAKEFDSIDHHRQELGGEPWPLFDRFLRLMRRVPTGALPEEPEEPKEGGP